MLAKHYDHTEPEGWWMSEKFDGVRAVWNGSEFISRNGKPLKAPQHMIDQMPKGVVLDGELWGGRGSFQASVGKIRRGDWQGISYMVFDTITESPFEARQATLTALSLPDWCKVVEHVKCASDDHLDDYEDAVLTKGGEGVMLRKPGSLYQHKRSDELLKLKRGRCDEAEVIGYDFGTGRNAGRVGALLARYAGQVFKLGNGLSDDQREAPPVIGSTVTFSFFELTTGGKPRFPVFIGVRDYE